MGAISLRQVGLTATTPLFQNLTLSIGDGDHVGLVAGNGRGKTSLLRCLAGLAEPSEGDIVRSRGLKMGFVEQDVPAALLGLTLRQAVLGALSPDQQATEAWRVDVALDEFATPEALRDRPVAQLSGGWQRLMLIARVWVMEPDALLLDEPTNHLDLGKLYQLEAWLRTSTRSMPVVIASHDRDFLDATTNRTLFLRPETSRYFALPYSAARQALTESDTADQVKLDRDLKQAKQLRQNAAKLTNIGINSGSDLLTVKAKYLKDRAGKIEAAAKPAHKERSGEIRLSNSGTHARVPVSLDDVTVSTPSGDALFKTGKLLIFQGDRLVVLGRNGAGKSQLVRLLRLAMTEGTNGIKVTPSVVLGYIDQAMSQLPEASTPSEIIAGFAVGDMRNRSLLASAGLPIEKQGRPVTELSFGQRARLGMLALRLTEPNFYLMDEPTNHLDIAGVEALENEMLEQGATCVVVSHDRSFVRTIGTRFFEVQRRRLVEVNSPEPFFLEMAKAENNTP
ncbi:MAG TPA: ABC-F family ATP-binding cassette domain-containing protein [Devosiaceae bacterium]|jgi:ATPase subunit of ABC transporter with duplicated ATPase domains